jgi:DNA-binding NarL/FixJ family response regulator
MSISPFHVLFLGEDLTWSKFSQALAVAPRASIKIHRAQSLNELVLILAGGHWHVVALDVHAWNFQGLQYVDKVRSEYPSLPILALCSSAVYDLENKARNAGASHTITLESMNSATLFSAISSTLADLHPNSHARSDSTEQLTFHLPDPGSNSRNQAISHALNNLLCVITANADQLAEHVTGSTHGEHSLSEIKKAAKSASDLMRELK